MTLVFSALLVTTSAVFYASLFFFPAQDGPGHVLNAYAMLGSLQGTHPFASEFWAAYDPVFLISNCFGTLVIMIGGIAGDYEAGYRCLLLVCVLITASGFAWLYRSMNKEWGDGLVPGAVVIVFMHELFLGFFNWAAGLGIGFACIAYWVQTRHRPGWKAPVILGLMWLLAFWVHALACNMLLFSYIAISGFGVLFDRGGMKTRDLMIRWYAPLIPAAAACIYYASLIPSDNAGDWNFIFVYENFRYVEVIRPFHDKALWTGRAIGVLFLIGIVEAMLERFSEKKRPGIQDGVLAASALFVLAFVLMPFARFLTTYQIDDLVNPGRIGAYLNTRMLAPGVLLMCVWYGSRKTPWARAMTAGIALLSLVHGSVIAAECLKVQDDFKEISAAGSAIPPQSVVMHESSSPEMGARHGNYYTHPYVHTTALAVVKSQDSIYLGRFGANSGYLFPHQFMKKARKLECDTVLVWKGSNREWPDYEKLYGSDKVTLYKKTRTPSTLL